MRTGNKANAGLNGEYATHVRAWLKKHTSRLRRMYNKRLIRKLLDE